MSASTDKRRTDPRKDYTISRITDAFLKLKAAKPFDAISVSEIAREAGVSRSTFYANFSNTRQVLDTAIHQALDECYSTEEALFTDSGNPRKVPFCDYIRHNKKYQAIFMDQALLPPVIDQLFERKLDCFRENLLSAGYTDAQIQTMLRFQISGCMTALIQNAKKPTKNGST